MSNVIDDKEKKGGMSKSAGVGSQNNMLKQQLLNNIRFVKSIFPKNKQKELVELVEHSRIQWIASEYGFDIKALTVVYQNYRNELENSTKSNEKTAIKQTKLIVNPNKLIIGCRFSKNGGKFALRRRSINDDKAMEIYKYQGTKEDARREVNRLARDEAYEYLTKIKAYVKETTGRTTISKTNVCEKDYIFFKKWDIYRTVEENLQMLDSLDLSEEQKFLLNEYRVDYKKLNNPKYPIAKTVEDIEFCKKLYDTVTKQKRR